MRSRFTPRPTQKQNRANFAAFAPLEMQARLGKPPLGPVNPKFITEAVPFVQIGNRRGLTALQLVENPHLADFVKRFPNSFEPAGNMDVVFFIEPKGLGK